MAKSPALSGARAAGQEHREKWHGPSDTLGGSVTSRYYEIRIAGVLPPEAIVDYERLGASIEPVETVLHGPLQDQAALYGLLARLETFGLQVVEVRRMHDQSPPGG